MKYYKYDNGFGKQPNNIIPSFATEITEEEYNQLMAEFEAKQKAIADYTEKVKAGEITLEEVPTEYYQEVYDRINEPKPVEPDITQSEAYMAGYDQAVLDLIEQGVL